MEPKGHRLITNVDNRGYQGECSCGKYRSKWQQYPGVVVSLHRTHVSRAEAKEREKDR